MGDGKSDTQSPELQISKMAIASALLGILGISITVLRLAFYRPWWSEFVARNIAALMGIVGLIPGFMVLLKISKRIAVITSLVICCFFFLHPWPLLLISFARGGAGRFWAGHPLVQRCSLYLSIACLVGLLAIPASREWRSSSKANFRGGALAPLGTVLGVLLVGFWWMETCGPASLALNQGCSSNLRQVGKAVLIYANDHGGRYPEPAQWCDLLLQRGQVETGDFLCPRVKWEWRRQVFPWPVPKNEKCYYAMNPNCEPNAPSDTVLLFETKGGWNRFGGPEFLTLENHRGDGCSVLFNDGRAEFVIRKRIADLKWGVEEENRESIK